jgi:hypothetical protein
MLKFLLIILYNKINFYLWISDLLISRVGFDFFPASVFRQNVELDLGVVEVTPNELGTIRRPPECVVVLENFLLENPIGDSVVNLQFK